MVLRWMKEELCTGELRQWSKPVEDILRESRTLSTSKVQDLTSLARHSTSNILTAKDCVLIRETVRTQVARRGCVLALTAQDDINGYGIAVLLAGLGVDHLLTAVLEDGGLNESLGSHAAVDTSVHGVVVLADVVKRLDRSVLCGKLT